MVRTGEGEWSGHFIYPSGLTATSPKIGEDGRRYLGRMVRAGEGEWLYIFYTPSSLRDRRCVIIANCCVIIGIRAKKPF